MKKVIVLLAVLSIMGGWAMAAITDSHSEDFGCGACHSAHGSVDPCTTTTVPLWGLTVTTELLKAYGDGTTIRGVTPGAPSNESALCMSCHDGATNTSGTGAIIGTTDANDGYVNTLTGHPISFTYSDSNDTNFENDPVDGGSGSIAILYDGRVECSSCHDIHGGTNPNNSQPYALRGGLATNDDAEDHICKSCHIR